MIATPVVAAAEGLEVPAPVATVEVVVAAAERAKVAASAVKMVIATAPNKPTGMFEAVAVAPVAVTVETTAIPRADSDELASNEIRRAPVAVRRAVIRIVIVVAVRAYRRCYVASVDWADPDAD